MRESATRRRESAACSNGWAGKGYIRCAPGVRHRTARRAREEGIRTRCISLSSFFTLSLPSFLLLSFVFFPPRPPVLHPPCPITVPNPVSPLAIPPRSSYVPLGSILRQPFRYFFVSLLCDL